MAHKTMVGGTVYEVTGGKTLIDGTAYNIKSGKTLVNGTVYDVSFGPAKVTITLKGTPTITSAMGNTYVYRVDGSGDRYEFPSTFKATIGESLYINVSSAFQCYIYLNGEVIASGSNSTSYNYIAVSDATIEIKDGGSGYSSYIKVYITDANT